MKFAEHLFTHLTSEWRAKYIEYDKLKEDLYNYIKEAPPAEAGEARKLYFESKDEEFFAFCEDELAKINFFYLEQISAAESRLRTLRTDMMNACDEIQGIRTKRSTVDSVRSRSVQKMSRATSVRDSLHRSPHDAASRPGISQEQRFQEINAILSAPRNKKVLDSLRTAYSEFYLQLVLIQNFQELNATGFRKILKKHDKLLETSSGHQWRVENVLPKEFVRDNKVNDLIAEVESTYITAIEGGDRTKAMKRLRVPPLSEKASPWTTFRLGLFFGAFAVLFVVVCLTTAFRPVKDDARWIGVRLFRGFLIIFINILLVGINHYGWQRAGVNNVLIFELDPRDHLNYQNIMELAMCFLVMWALAVLGYQYHDVIRIPKLLMPLLLMTILVGWLLNPFRYLFWSSRRWFLYKCYILCTPLCHSVLFADFWLADQFNSLVTFILDMEYFVCFYATEVQWSNLTIKRALNGTQDAWVVNFETGEDMCTEILFGIRPILAVIPASIRFFQCIRRFVDSRDKHPHLTNAGKYSTTFFVVLFSTMRSWYATRHRMSGYSWASPFFYMWICSYVVSTVYTYVWDIRMDWGLGTVHPNGKHSWENTFLRDGLMIYPKYCYYAAIVGDLFLRLAWTLNVSLHDFFFSDKQDILVCVTALLECFRRFVWNFFRLENEHTNNCGRFRAVRDISVKVIPREPDEPQAQPLLKRQRQSFAKMLQFKVNSG